MDCQHHWNHSRRKRERYQHEDETVPHPHHNRSTPTLTLPVVEGVLREVVRKVARQQGSCSSPSMSSSEESHRTKAKRSKAHRGTQGNEDMQRKAAKRSNASEGSEDASSVIADFSSGTSENVVVVGWVHHRDVCFKTFGLSLSFFIQRRRVSIFSCKTSCLSRCPNQGCFMETRWARR